MKTVQDDPMFDKKRAQKKLRAFVESDSYTISQKAEMMVEHFHEQVISKGKIGGQARAMVVTSSIPRCIEYYYAINKCLSARHSPYKTIVAFSGEHKYQDQKYLDSTPIIRGINGTELVDLILKYYHDLSDKYKKMIPLKMVYIPVAKDEQE